MDDRADHQTFKLHSVPPRNKVVEIIDDVEIIHGFVGGHPTNGDYIFAHKTNTRFQIYDYYNAIGETIYMVRRV